MQTPSGSRENLNDPTPSALRPSSPYEDPIGTASGLSVVVTSEGTALGSAEHIPSAVAQLEDDRGQSGTSAVARSAQLAWEGFKFVSKSLGGLLDGTPFGTPMAVLNTFIDIADTVADNKDGMRDLVNQIRNRLETIDDALLKTENEETTDRIHNFAKILIEQVIELDKMMSRSLGRRILESEEDVGKVKGIFFQLDEHVKNFHVDISLSIERQATAIFKSIQQLHLASWPRSRQALYDADVASSITRKSCTEGTRTKIIGDIFNWARNSSSAPVYWLNGLAGTGKSTIAYTTCQQAAAKHTDILVASFFCSKQINDARERKYIVPTIVYQLARRSRSYAQLLLKADFDAVDVSRRQMLELLVDPWQKSASDRPSDLPPRLVVIDALDECEEGYEFLRELLVIVESGELLGLKFLVTSRPDPNIVTQCKDFAPDSVCRLHEVEAEEVKSDVRKFLTKELPASLQQKPEFEELVEQAGGLFIYAATAVRFISPSYLRLAEDEQAVKLEALVKAQPLGGSKDANPYLLDDLYRDVLRDGLRISHGEKVWRRRLSILHTILSVGDPHDPEDISILSSTSVTVIDKDMVLHAVNDLHAVLYVSHRAIYWHHKSFLDFMRDPERARLSDNNTSSLTITQINLSYDVSSQSIALCRTCLHIIQISFEDPFLTKSQSERFICIINQFLQADILELPETVSMAFNIPFSGRKVISLASKLCVTGFPLYIRKVPLDAHLYDFYKDINAFMHSTKVLSYTKFILFDSLYTLYPIAKWLRLFYKANRGNIADILPPFEYEREIDEMAIITTGLD